MKNYLYWILLSLLTLAACDKYDDYYLNIPSYGDYSLANETNALNAVSRQSMEGIYRVVRGSDMLGEQVVLKWTTDKYLSVFGEKKAIYAVLSGGSLEDILLFEGYWRCALNDDTGLIRFFIKREHGSTNILNAVADSDITLLGTCFDNGLEHCELELKRIETFSEELRNSNFLVLAHRAGGRTADKLPVSENSCEMVLYTERLGSTGIEIDVQLTKDGVPVVYHDDDINVRLTQKGPIMGPLSNYTYEQLNAMVRLYHGERIPTLQQLLDTVLYKTNLRFVWIDNKNADALKVIAPIQKKYMKLAAQAEQQGRNKLEMVLGLPDKKRVDAYLTIPYHQEIPSLCEISIDETKRAGAKVFAPRWTMGTQPAAIDDMHNNGCYCFVWTLDDPQFMHDYVVNADFDGILTNYPTLLSYYHYVFHNN